MCGGGGGGGIEYSVYVGGRGGSENVEFQELKLA